MSAEGQREQDPKEIVKGDDDITSAVPQDRAGVTNGPPGEIPTKYKDDCAIQISEVISKKRYPKTLYVATHRNDPKTGKVLYQLRETKQDNGVYYRNGHWFPEKEVHVLK